MTGVPAIRTPGNLAIRPSSATGLRQAWLDALRGIAALAVVFDHLGSYVLQHARYVAVQWFDPGMYGVLVFFLVSGYIIPASLDRKGDIRRFWAGRLFRLYPLYLLAVAAAVMLWRLGLGSVRGADQHAVTAALAHLFMMSNVLGAPNVINVLWTLSYEMIFYLLLTALYAVGVHRRSSSIALAFAAAAVAVGGLLPVTALSGNFSGRLVAGIADLLVACGVALAMARHRVPKTVGALLAAATALILLAVNGTWIYPFQAFSILALMFTGSVLYRAKSGELSLRRAAATALIVLTLATVAGLWHSHAWGLPAAAELQWERQWTSSLILAGVTFAVGMACRHRKVPASLAWLGQVSYSIYLLHPLLIQVYRHIPGTSSPQSLPLQLMMAATFLLVLLACSAASHRLVEAPMQRQGRKLIG